MRCYDSIQHARTRRGAGGARPRCRPTARAATARAYYEEDEDPGFLEAAGRDRQPGRPGRSTWTRRTISSFSASPASSDGAYQVNFKDPGKREIYSSPASNVNAVGTGQFPVPWLHGMTYPAGGQIGITLINKNGGTNNVELILIGVARYPINR
jgi:hypothetical protein